MYNIKGKGGTHSRCYNFYEVKDISNIDFESIGLNEGKDVNESMIEFGRENYLLQQKYEKVMEENIKLKEENDRLKKELREDKNQSPPFKRAKLDFNFSEMKGKVDDIMSGLPVEKEASLHNKPPQEDSLSSVKTQVDALVANSSLWTTSEFKSLEGEEKEKEKEKEKEQESKSKQVGCSYW
ncbi:hypothetical protein [Coxiella burnetii]|uniref:hypothetical protein n=1 Tax=Coxiella burnetii TaxID=777 RepID=UPI0000DAE063|nr:hypothetical protein [Coxiella burnetii]